MQLLPIVFIQLKRIKYMCFDDSVDSVDSAGALNRCSMHYSNTENGIL